MSYDPLSDLLTELQKEAPRDTKTEALLKLILIELRIMNTVIKEISDIDLNHSNFEGDTKL